MRRIVVAADLDDTLIDTSRLFYDLRLLATTLGVPDSIWEDAHDALGSLTPYSIEAHFELLRGMGADFPNEALQSSLMTDFRNLSRYLYADALMYLLDIQKLGLDFYIVSRGHPKWQWEKISLTGLANYVPAEKCIFGGTDLDKVARLRCSLEEPMLLSAVDNNVTALNAVRMMFPNALTYHINRIPSFARNLRAPKELLARYELARKYNGWGMSDEHVAIRSFAEIEMT